MPQPPTLKIKEIFSSLQGEGLRQGEPTTFIRFSGCNLNCYFCDTKYAWEEGREISTIEILEKVKEETTSFPTEWVCLTGGEPLLQGQGLEELVKELKKEGFKLQVETNGTIYRDLEVDWFSVSPKPPEYFFQPGYRKNAKEVKLVVTKELDLEVVQRLRKEFSEKIPILLQPQSNQKWSMEKGRKLLTESVSHRLKNIKVSVQLHKIYNLP